MSRIFAMAAAALAVAFPSGARPASVQAGMEVSIQGQVGAGQGVQDLDTDTDVVVYGAILGSTSSGPSPSSSTTTTPRTTCLGSPARRRSSRTSSSPTCGSISGAGP